VQGDESTVRFFVVGFLIDSGIFVAIERGALSSKTLEERIGDAPAFISVVTTSELWHGVYRALSEDKAAKRAAFIERATHLVPALDVDDFVAREHARLWAHLQSKGRMIGIHDSWIAATALTYDLIVATRNPREFHRVPGLRMDVW